MRTGLLLEDVLSGGPCRCELPLGMDAPFPLKEKREHYAQENQLENGGCILDI